MVNQDQAVEIAKRELAKQGQAATDYTITVDAQGSAADQWIIWFDKKGPFPVPGGRLGIRVNKSTGQPEYMPGE